MSSTFGGRTMIVVDLLVVAWIAAWLMVGARVSNEVDGLTELSATVSDAGGAVLAHRALRTLSYRWLERARLGLRRPNG